MHKYREKERNTYKCMHAYIHRNTETQKHNTHTFIHACTHTGKSKLLAPRFTAQCNICSTIHGPHAYIDVDIHTYIHTYMYMNTYTNIFITHIRLNTRAAEPRVDLIHAYIDACIHTYIHNAHTRKNQTAGTKLYCWIQHLRHHMWACAS